MGGITIMTKIKKLSLSGEEMCQSCKKRKTCKDFKKHDYPIACFLYEEDK